TCKKLWTIRYRQSTYVRTLARENLFAALVGGVSGWSISTPPTFRQVLFCVHELNKYAPTEQRPRLLLHGAWQRFLIFSHNVIGHKQISFAFHPLLARTGHTSQLRILRKEQLSPALRLRLKILIGHSSRCFLRQCSLLGKR